MCDQDGRPELGRPRIKKCSEHPPSCGWQELALILTTSVLCGNSGKVPHPGSVSTAHSIAEPCRSVAAQSLGPLMTIHEEPRHMGFTIKDRVRAMLIYIHAVLLCLAVPIKVPPHTPQLCHK